MLNVACLEPALLGAKSIATFRGKPVSLSKYGGFPLLPPEKLNSVASGPVIVISEMVRSPGIFLIISK